MFIKYRIPLQSCFCLFLMFLFATLAGAQEITPITDLYVASEISHQNGVLVSRPQPLHQEIVDLIDRNKIKSLEDYAKWLKDNIHYQNDGTKDIWSTPEQMLRKKTGDCEDYALLNASVLQVLGYQPHFLALVRNDLRHAHAICTFKYNGYFLWFDNAKLKKTSTASLEQLARDLSEQYHYSTLFEFNLKTKNWNILYKKS